MAPSAPLISEDNLEYPTLEKSKKEIRLLHFENIDAQGVLHCKLSAVSLNEAPVYNALSYCWGNGDARDFIFVNGSRFWVRPNLFNFLKTLEHVDWLGCFCFIDAVCINQLDVEERASQVGLMGDVYSGAHEVVAWLGRKEDSDWKESTYWPRLWVVQEFVLAPKLMIQIDQTKVQWTAFNQLINFSETLVKTWEVTRQLSMRDLIVETPPVNRMPHWWRRRLRGQDRPERRHKIRSLYALAVMFGQRLAWQKLASPERGTALHELIVLLGTQESHEPRDKIFGLLGIARTCIKADYNVPMTTLYLQVLIEGLHDIQACHSKDPEPMQRIRLSQCQVACLSTLGLPIDATLCLITHRAMQRCDVVAGDQTLYFTIRALFMDVFLYAARAKLMLPGIDCRRTPSGHWLTWLSSWISAIPISTSLHDLKQHNIRFGPCAEDKRTFAEWINLVDETVDDYRHKSHLSIRASTEAHQLGIRPVENISCIPGGPRISFAILVFFNVVIGTTRQACMYLCFWAASILWKVIRMPVSSLVEFSLLLCSYFLLLERGG